MQRKNVRFENDAGETLSGILDLPVSKPIAYALAAHCFTCSKNLKAANHISRSLNDAGIAVLRFDFTGLGQSEGDFADTSFTSNVGDLVAACRYLARDFAAPSHVEHLFESARHELEESGEALVKFGTRSLRVKKSFLDDLWQHPMADCVGSLRKALLVMHAPLDDLVEIECASELFLMAKHPKNFVSLDKADHLLSREEDSKYVGRVLAAWASRYLATSDVSAPVEGGPEEVVARTFADGFRTDLSIAGHPMVADEPLRVGGTDEGPTPYGLLAAALASCTSMTLRMYANHKKLNLTSATVRVSHDKIHAVDCGDCESSSGKIDEFRRTISFEGSLTKEQKARMLEIADLCPVHKTLHGEIKIRPAVDPAD